MLVSAAVTRSKAAAAAAKGRQASVPNKLPPFELQGSDEALGQLMHGIVGWRVEKQGSRASNVWLKSADGAAWLIGVDQRDLAPMFEVFTLSIQSMADLLDQWSRWEVPPEASSLGLPEGLRQIIATKPAPPVPPTEFEPWPFSSWRTEIARRAEFIVEGADVGPTFGNNPNTQSAARPGAVPDDASAFSEVVAGLVFTGEHGRMLIAVDWLPFNLLVSDDASEIDNFISTCALIELGTYLQSRS